MAFMMEKPFFVFLSVVCEDYFVNIKYICRALICPNDDYSIDFRPVLSKLTFFFFYFNGIEGSFFYVQSLNLVQNYEFAFIFDLVLQRDDLKAQYWSSFELSNLNQESQSRRRQNLCTFRRKSNESYLHQHFLLCALNNWVNTNIETILKKF